MNDLRKYLQEERLRRLNRAWGYLGIWQHISLFIRATWWSLPNVIEIVRHIRLRFNAKLAYYLYTAHWI